MTPEEQAAYEKVPHLISPAMLAHIDTGGKWQLSRAHDIMNRVLIDVTFNPGSRTIINIPFQHGKTTFVNYWMGWTLLHNPECRILYAMHTEALATEQGSKVKGIIDRFGPEQGVVLKEDTKAKGEWKIVGARGVMEEGGMVCRGLHGAMVGRPADIFVIDDPLKDAEQAMSPLVLQSNWNWYKTVVEGRIRNSTSIVIVMTRWSKADLCGRVLAESKETGEKWNVIKLKALAESDDPLGRKIGEPLWPEVVSKAHLLNRQKTSKFFRANYQQEPPDEEGAHFRPRANAALGIRGWPLYKKIAEHVWSLEPFGMARRIYPRDECIVLMCVDWARTVKETSDYSAIGIFALTPDRHLLILDMVRRRLRLEQLAPEIAAVCVQWRPNLVAVEAGHPTLNDDCHRFPEIPDVRWVSPESKDKLRRALPAIVKAENGNVFLPESASWLEDFLNEVAAFTGIADDHDDQVDAFSMACSLAESLRPTPRRESTGPALLAEGRDMEGGQRPRLGGSGYGYPDSPWGGLWNDR